MAHNVDKLNIEVTKKDPRKLKSFRTESPKEEPASKPGVSGGSVGKGVNLFLPMEWHDALEEACRDIRAGHTEYDRFRNDALGAHVSKTSLIKTLIREYLQSRNQGEDG